MIIDPQEIDKRRVYQCLIAVITPRPIAWVTTRSSGGIHNLAPFSFYSGICSNPPSLLFCPANNRDGKPKDTLSNIESNGEFVVNSVSYRNREAMSHSSYPFPPDIDEIQECSLSTLPAETVKPVRIAEADIHMECTLSEIVRIGSGPGSGNVVIGLIRRFHFADSILDDEGLPDPEKLNTIGRMGGSEYCKTTQRFKIERPG